MLGFGAIGESAISALPDRYTIATSDTPEGKERIRSYYEALGRFVDRFARVEATVTLTLRKYAQTNDVVSKVVFAGAKIEVSSAYIKQLAEGTGAPKEARDDLEYVLQQLGTINGVRNSVVHFGATSVAEGNAIVSNALKAKGEPTIFPISPTILDQMTEDLSKIIYHLQYWHLFTDSPERPDVVMESVLRSPWQYKRPQPPRAQSQKAPRSSSRKRDPKPPRQPSS